MTVAFSRRPGGACLFRRPIAGHRHDQNSEALVLAEDMIKGRQDAAANDFRLVNSTSTQAGIFTQKTEVSTHSFFTKKITASVSWDFGGRRQEVQLQTLISDWRGTAGNDTCDSNLSGDWKNPQVEHFDFTVLSETASSTISDIDAYKNKLYVAVEDTSTSTDPTLFLFQYLDPKNLPYLITAVAILEKQTPSRPMMILFI